jgi:hypothetical protein
MIKQTIRSSPSLISPYGAKSVLQAYSTSKASSLLCPSQTAKAGDQITQRSYPSNSDLPNLISTYVKLFVFYPSPQSRRQRRGSHLHFDAFASPDL